MQAAHVERFWAFCAHAGMTSKRLSIQNTVSPCFPLRLCVEEKVKYGAPVVSVPYLAVLNVETIRGDMVPRSLPPFRKVHAFLTRRGRLDSTTAQSLWLAAFLSTYARQTALHRPDALPLALDAVLCDAIMPPLPSPFLPANAAASPAIGSQPPLVLQQWERRVEEEVQLMRYVTAFHARRSGVRSALVPTDDEMLLAYRTVLQRSVLLPAGCEPSAPAELAELIQATPELPVLPSLVPAVDLVRPASASAVAAEDGAAGPAAEGNCTLYTCVHSDFVSSSSRRRAVMETLPLAARRVVICAAKDLNAGDELTMDFE